MCSSFALLYPMSLKNNYGVSIDRFSIIFDGRKEKAPLYDGKKPDEFVYRSRSDAVKAIANI